MAVVIASLLASAFSGAPSTVAGEMVFFSMGDWGGASDTAPTTTSELSNGHGMDAAAGQLGKPRFVMAVGDNFYGSGIQGSEFSPRFKSTFEDAFPEAALQVPWYVIAGNHDHLGNVTAQIKYSDHSSRWTYPSQYYTYTESFADPATGANVSTQVVYIDTVIVAGMSYKDEATGEFIEGEEHPAQRLLQSQLGWLEDTLKASTADYLWVAGHYPVYSHCQHGPTLKLILRVLRLLFLRPPLLLLLLLRRRRLLLLLLRLPLSLLLLLLLM